jgi:hypothetical protein
VGRLKGHHCQFPQDTSRPRPSPRNPTSIRGFVPCMCGEYKQISESTLACSLPTHPILVQMSRPSMRGWWMCCRCSQTNYPNLSASSCTKCNHTKCRYCQPWPQSAPNQQIYCVPSTKADPKGNTPEGGSKAKTEAGKTP